LDSILLKALEKDRSRRYASAADFGADIGRYLRNEGVLAVPPSTAYRARKFIRRHRAGLATLTAFMLILIAAAVVSTRESIVAKRQRDRADSEAAVAKAVNEFLQNDLLSQADSGAQDGSDSPVDPEVKVRTLLDRAAGRVEKRFASQPLVESQIQDTIGQAYLGLGLAGEAEKHLRRAYDLSAAHRGADAPETLGLLLSISEASAHQDKYSDAVIAAKAAYEGEARTLGAEDPKTVVALQNLAVMYIYTNQYTEAEPLLKKALNIQQRLNGYDNLDTLNTSDSLAELYIEQSRYAEARPLLAKGLESYLRVFGSDHPYTDRERFGLGKVLYGEGNYKEAEKVFAECLANEVRVRGKLHPDTLTTTEYLGESLVGEGDHARGIPLLEGALRDFRKAEGPGVEDTLRDEAALGQAYDSKGDLVRAEQNLRTAVQGLKALGKDQEDNAADAGVARPEPCGTA
jgi:eukaryotic-like serine/threonine-protein kinase